MPVCRVCAAEKADDAFHVRRDTGRRRTDCIACRAAARTQWMKLHPEVNRRAKRAHYERNKDQQVQRSRAWAIANPDKIHDTHLRRTFGISGADYAAMVRNQGGACAVCRKPEDVIDQRSGRVRRLHVDHDHETGEVRALLCTRCNMAVGYLRDDADLAMAVADYLRGMRARKAGIEVREVSA